MMLRNIIITAALAGLAACSAQTQTSAFVSALCAQDAVLQPIGAAAATAAGQGAAAAAETVTVHAALQAACAAGLGGPLAPAPAGK